VALSVLSNANTCIGGQDRVQEDGALNSYKSIAPGLIEDEDFMERISTRLPP
jgi:hypothetical protein